jgi:hypothetical protein
MSKQDQNRVNLGPARIKTDDSIYDAVDQGIVGVSTTTVVAPTDPGFVPIGPIGDLITPPVLDPVTGYPIYNADINFINDSNYLSMNFRTPWNIIDTSAIGGFSNSLVVCDAVDLYYVNLDNPSQLATFVGKDRNQYPDFVLREGVLTSGWSSFIGGVWVAESVDITINGVTKTISGTTIDGFLANGVRDNLYTYINLGTGWNSGSGNIHAYAKVPHSGPLTLEVVAYGRPVGWSFSFAGTVMSVREDIMWISGYTNPGGSSPLFQVAAINLITNEMTPAYSFSSQYQQGPWFSITGGFAAWLGSATTVGGNYVYKLYIVGLDGSLVTQANFMSIPASSGPFSGDRFDSAEVPGTDTVLAINSGVPSTLYQISAAGYQIVSGTPNLIETLRIGPASPGALRFWGSTYPDYPRIQAIYEFAL